MISTQRASSWGWRIPERDTWRGMTIVGVLMLWPLGVAHAQEGGLREPLPRTKDAKLVARLGPHQVAIGEKCRLSETLQCRDAAAPKAVFYEIHRVAFYHRGLDRMVMTDSDDSLDGTQFAGLSEGQTSTNTPHTKDSPGRPRRVVEFTPRTPGLFTINVVWTIRRERQDGTAWLEKVQSHPVLLRIDPTAAWKERQTPTSPLADADAFAENAEKAQLLLERAYADGEHDP